MFFVTLKTAMNVTLTGATGFIGTPLVQRLLSRGHSLHLLGHKQPAGLPPSVEFSIWASTQDDPPVQALQGADAIIHLAGEPVAQRWTPEVKQRIRKSRVEGTLKLAQSLKSLSRLPGVLICASATGIYGSRGDEELTESSAPGDGFLAETTVEWEKAADFAEALGVRLVKIRTGVVLGKGGGALKKMLPPFRLGLGGPIGSGRQWMSWIHLDDITGLFLYALENPLLRGPVNGTAPTPVTNAEFSRELGRALHRPAIMWVPEFALKLMFGEMASVVLASQRVLPKAAREAEYQFKYPELAPALASIVK